jgi:DNA polymerase-3 subunit delta'
MTAAGAAAPTEALERLGRRGDAFPGALLLKGSSASRLEAEARRLAARLLCPTDCGGSCDSCRRVASGAHPDLFVVEPEGVQIKIDRVRQALVFAAGRPYEAPRRVALVLEADLLGLEAANALLKSLEEPGSRLHWILTTHRPESESLLPTIRSRCATAIVPALSRAERTAVWLGRGFSAEDAADLALFADEDVEASEARGLLEEYREFRSRILAALDAGVGGEGASAAPLLLAAEDAARAEPPFDSLLAELLADAALAAAGSPDRARHRAVAGALSDLGRRRSSEAFRRAALAVADPPPDNRRGNRRLHLEAALLRLHLAR